MCEQPVKIESNNANKESGTRFDMWQINREQPCKVNEKHFRSSSWTLIGSKSIVVWMMSCPFETAAFHLGMADLTRSDVTNEPWSARIHRCQAAAFWITINLKNVAWDMSLRNWYNCTWKTLTAAISAWGFWTTIRDQDEATVGTHGACNICPLGEWKLHAMWYVLMWNAYRMLSGQGHRSNSWRQWYWLYMQSWHDVPVCEHQLQSGAQNVFEPEAEQSLMMPKMMMCETNLLNRMPMMTQLVGQWHVTQKCSNAKLIAVFHPNLCETSPWPLLVLRPASVLPDVGVWWVSILKPPELSGGAAVPAARLRHHGSKGRRYVE